MGGRQEDEAVGAMARSTTAACSSSTSSLASAVTTNLTCVMRLQIGRSGERRGGRAAPGRDATGRHGCIYDSQIAGAGW